MPTFTKKKLEIFPHAMSKRNACGESIIEVATTNPYMHNLNGGANKGMNILTWNAFFVNDEHNWLHCICIYT